MYRPILATLTAILVVLNFAHTQAYAQGDITLTMQGIGPVRLGMTVEEAVASGKVPLVRIDPNNRLIRHTTGDALYMVDAKSGKIQVACATSARVKTSHGIRIDDSVKKLGQFSRTDIKVQQNHYELSSTDPKNRGRVIWFESHGGKITAICASTPAVHSYLMQGGT